MSLGEAKLLTVENHDVVRAYVGEQCRSPCLNIYSLSTNFRPIWHVKPDYTHCLWRLSCCHRRRPNRFAKIYPSFSHIGFYAVPKSGVCHSFLEGLKRSYLVTRLNIHQQQKRKLIGGGRCCWLSVSHTRSRWFTDQQMPLPLLSCLCVLQLFLR